MHGVLDPKRRLESYEYKSVYYTVQEFLASHDRGLQQMSRQCHLINNAKLASYRE